MAMATMTNYEFLLRTQSEDLVAYKGSCEDSKALSDGWRPNGLWMKDDKTVCLRLRKQENRPKGSLLTRTCTCGHTALVAFCMACKLKVYLERFQVGDKVWDFKSATFLSSVRRALAGLNCDDAHLCTFKAFRAGKAHELSARGMHIADILLMGEWKGRAFLRYGQPEDIDVNAYRPLGVLQAAMEHSDNEGDEMDD